MELRIGMDISATSIHQDYLLPKLQQSAPNNSIRGLQQQQNTAKQTVDVVVEVLAHQLPDLKNLMVKTELSTFRLAHILEKHVEITGDQLAGLIANQENLSHLLHAKFEVNHLIQMLSQVGPNYYEDLKCISARFNRMPIEYKIKRSAAEINRQLLYLLKLDKLNTTCIPNHSVNDCTLVDVKELNQIAKQIHGLRPQIQSFLWETGFNSTQLIGILSSSGSQCLSVLTQALDRKDQIIELSKKFHGVHILTAILRGSGKYLIAWIDALPKYESLVTHFVQNPLLTKQTIKTIRKELFFNDYPPARSKKMDELELLGFTIKGIYSVASCQVSHFNQIVDFFYQHREALKHFMNATRFNASSLTSILNQNGTQTKKNFEALLKSQSIIVDLVNAGLEPTNLSTILHGSRSKLEEDLQLLVQHKDQILEFKRSKLKVVSTLPRLKKQFFRLNQEMLNTQNNEQTVEVSATKSEVTPEDNLHFSPPLIQTAQKDIQTLQQLSLSNPESLTQEEIEVLCDPLSQHLWVPHSSVHHSLVSESAEIATQPFFNSELPMNNESVAIPDVNTDLLNLTSELQSEDGDAFFRSFLSSIEFEIMNSHV